MSTRQAPEEAGGLFPLGLRPTRAGNLRAVKGLRALVDQVAIFAGFGLSFSVYVQAIQAGWLIRPLPEPGRYVFVTLLFGSLTFGVFWARGLYRDHAGVLDLSELEASVRALVLASLAFFALLFFFKLETFSRLVVVGGMGTATVLLILTRRMVSQAARHLSVSRRLGRRVLIVGTGETGRLLMKQLARAPHAGRRVVGFLTDDGSAGEAVTCRLSQSHGTLFRAPILGGLPALEPLVSEHGIDEILIADPAVVSDTRLLHQIIQACRARGLTVGVVPQMGDIRADQLHVDDVGTVSILRPHARSGGGPRGLAKRGLDIAVSLVLLVMTAPLWALAAVLIRLDGPGPVFFRQRRIGLNGRPFVLIKFRTMHSDADPYAPSVDGLSDSRVTRFGRFLRQGGFDELPQLLNVLRGEMSLVGPRPEMPFIVDGYGVIERQRLRVKPGITGIWQLSADRLGQIHESLEYDLYYLQHQSLLLDVLVLLETFIFALQVPVRVAGSALRKARNEPRRGGPPDRPGGPGSRPGPRSNGRRAGGSRASRGASAKGST